MKKKATSKATEEDLEGLAEVSNETTPDEVSGDAELTPFQQLIAAKRAKVHQEAEERAKNRDSVVRTYNDVANHRPDNNE